MNEIAVTALGCVLCCSFVFCILKVYQINFVGDEWCINSFFLHLLQATPRYLTIITICLYVVIYIAKKCIGILRLCYSYQSHKLAYEVLINLETIVIS